MSRREEALGYPRPDTRGPPHLTSINFTLPYINLPPIHEMRLPRPTISKPAEELKSSEEGVGKAGGHARTASETVDERSSRIHEAVAAGSKGTVLQSPRLSLPTRSPAPSPEDAPSSPGSPPSQLPRQPFSTWLPDDSLQFINPRLLSEAEKKTLARERQRRGSGGCTPTPASSERPTPHQPDCSSSDSRQVIPVDEDSSREGSAHVQEGTPRTPVQVTQPRPAPPPRRPSIGIRARTADYDLLRQVKSNNLTFPSSAPPAHQPSFLARAPASHGVARSNVHGDRPLPFTHAPLVHPPATTQGPTAQSSGKIVHPPPPATYRPYPSVLAPTSPRPNFHLMPEFWTGPDATATPSGRVAVEQSSETHPHTASEARGTSSTPRHQR